MVIQKQIFAWNVKIIILHCGIGTVALSQQLAVTVRSSARQRNYHSYAIERCLIHVREHVTHWGYTSRLEGLKLRFEREWSSWEPRRHRLAGSCRPKLSEGSFGQPATHLLHSGHVTFQTWFISDENNTLIKRRIQDQLESHKKRTKNSQKTTSTAFLKKVGICQWSM